MIFKENNELFEITNERINLLFFKSGEKKGYYNITYKPFKDSELKLNSCYAAINFHLEDSKRLKEIASFSFSFDSQVENFEDHIGKGLKVIFIGDFNKDLRISFNIQFKIYENQPFILIKVIDIINNNKVQKAVHSISPLTIKNNTLWLSNTKFPSKLDKISWFKNGFQSWSPCELLFGNEKDNNGPSVEILNLIHDNQDYYIQGRFYSEYCTVITDLEFLNSLIIGFTSLREQFSRIIMDYEDQNNLRLLTAIGCLDGIKFNKSSINSSEELFICFKSENYGYYGLLDYAKVVKSNIIETRIKEIPIGWCSWYYYFTEITENEMIKNLQFFKKHREFPINFIQLDDGYFTKIGDYTNLNEKFPNGLKWLFNQIKDSGFKTGIWTAPFLAERKSEFLNQHKDWFIKRSDKLLKVLYNWGTFEYSLDLSNNQVLDYIRSFFENLIYAFNKGKIENKEPIISFFKIDFLHAAVPYNSDYKNSNLTRAQLYYNGLKVIRDAITNDSFLLGCGAPLGPCVGLVDAMRISYDTAPTWDAGFFEQFENKRGIPQPSLKVALKNTLYRSFMHKYFWINDPDCLMIRRSDTKLNLDEIRLQITLFGLSGGQILISDDMLKLTESELNDAKLTIPPYNPLGFDPIPIDAFTSPLPSIYILETDEKIGKRYLIAVINWEDYKVNKEIKLSEIMLNHSKDEEFFYVFDFWNKKFLGTYKIENILLLNNINPHSCIYLSIIPTKKEKIGYPILISTNLHISQGCCEIKNFEFKVNQNKINLEFELVGKREGFILLKLPPNKYIKKFENKFSKIDDIENIWELFVRFENNKQIEILIS